VQTIHPNFCETYQLGGKYELIISDPDLGAVLVGDGHEAVDPVVPRKWRTTRINGEGGHLAKRKCHVVARVDTPCADRGRAHGSHVHRAGGQPPSDLVYRLVEAGGVARTDLRRGQKDTNARPHTTAYPSP
jgi:hypothetical protein